MNEPHSPSPIPLNLSPLSTIPVHFLFLFQADNPDMGVTVADARFMKPLDVDLIRRLAGEHDAMLTVEENAVGGFGAHVLHFMVLDGLMDHVRLLCCRCCIVVYERLARRPGVTWEEWFNHLLCVVMVQMA